MRTAFIEPAPVLPEIHVLRWKKVALDLIALGVELPVQRRNDFRLGTGLLSNPGANRDMRRLYPALSQGRMQVVNPIAQPRAGNTDVGKHGHWADRGATCCEQQRATAACQHIWQYLFDGCDGAIDVEVDLRLKVR